MLVTPEAVQLDFEPAGIGSRLFAFLIDALVQAVVLFIALFGFAGVTSSVNDSGVTIAILLVIVSLVLFGYPTAMETLWRGRTLGKAAFGLRVVTREGAPVRFRHAAIRAVFGLIDFYATGGAGAVMCVLFTRDNQRLGDVVAGTLVLRERTGMRMPSAVDFRVPYGLESYAATLDVAGLTADDYGLVRSFLLRAPSLPPAIRADLAASVAGPVQHRLRTSPPPGVPAEAFLACVAAVKQHGRP